MEQRIVKRYSIAFKQQVVGELESGRFGSIMEAQEHYDIGGDGRSVQIYIAHLNYHEL